MSAVKRALREGGYPKVKVGHGGTLDPLASGVLPIALGEATKLAGRMLDADKGYEFTIRFGEETSTLDLEGEVVARSAMLPSLAQVGSVLAQFTGEIVQVPPVYSALMIDGKRAYDRARAGEAVEMVERHATVHTLTVRAEPVEALPSRLPDQEKHGSSTSSGQTVDEVIMAARVSKGTYIRALARDIARALGTVGHVTMLRRTHAGPFTLTPTISLDKLSQLATAGALEQALLPLTSALDDIPVLPVTPDQASALRQGRTIGTVADPGLAFAVLDDVPVAYVEIEDARMRVVRGFNL